MTGNNWETFFDKHAPDYHGEPWTNGTRGEVDFLERELNLSRGAAVLDVGCGTGRHSLELARRGYRVTGIDISQGMLKEAARAAREEGLSVRFLKADAANFSLDKKFDAAVCLCEGAFGLLDTGEAPFLRDARILKNIAACLKDGAPALLTVSSALPHIRRWSQDDVERGVFDLEDFVETFKMDDQYPEQAKNMVFKSKSFTPSELKLLMHIAGFAALRVGGGTADGWNIGGLTLDDHEILITGTKRNGGEDAHA